MNFNLKHLLFAMFVVGVGLAAFLNPQSVLAVNVVNLLVVATLILTAYGAWSSQGELRAFRLGFLLWCGLYYLDLTRRYLDIELGLVALLNYYWYSIREYDSNQDLNIALSRLFSISQALFALLLGLLGGWLTVYFYRKRQRMPSRKT